MLNLIVTVYKTLDKEKMKVLGLGLGLACLWSFGWCGECSPTTYIIFGKTKGYLVDSTLFRFFILVKKFQ